MSATLDPFHPMRDGNDVSCPSILFVTPFIYHPLFPHAGIGSFDQGPSYPPLDDHGSLLTPHLPSFNSPSSEWERAV